MSSTNKTTHYELPQFVDSDLFNPLVDDNDAYAKIDTALHNIADAEASDASEIVSVRGRVTTVEGKVTAIEAQNGNEVLATTAQTLSGAVNELNGDIVSLDGRTGVVEDDINNTNTGLKAKIDAINTEIAGLKDSDEELTNDIGILTNNLANTATTLNAKIDNASAILTNSINLEKTDRATADANLQSQIDDNNSDIASEVIARTNADSLLSTRIDEIVAPTGGAPSAAEVTDARVGADGVTYNSLGLAIRGQFDETWRDTNNRFETMSDSYSKGCVPTSVVAPSFVDSGVKIATVNGGRVADANYDIAGFNLKAYASNNNTAFICINDMGMDDFTYCFYSTSSFSPTTAVGTAKTGNCTGIIEIPSGANYIGIVRPTGNTKNCIYYFTFDLANINKNKIKNLNELQKNNIDRKGITANSFVSEKVALLNTGNRYQNDRFDIVAYRFPASDAGKKVFVYIDTVDNEYSYCWYDASLFDASSKISDVHYGWCNGLVTIPQSSNPNVYLAVLNKHGEVVNGVYDYSINNDDYPIVQSYLGCSGENGVVTAPTTKSGDAELIKFPSGAVMAIDFQVSSNAEALANAYQRRNITKLDYLVISHYHADHYGCLDYLVNTAGIDVNNAVIYCPPYLTNEQLARFSQAEQTAIITGQTLVQNIASAHNCTVIHPNDGDVLTIDGAKLTWYNCDFTDYYDSSSVYYSNNYNDFSICCVLEYGNMRTLYSGDIGSIAQSKLGGKLPMCNILKAQHHGWDNGDSALIPSYINNVMPELVVSVNGEQQAPTNTSSPACVYLEGSPLQTWCERYNVPNLLTILNGNIDIDVTMNSYKVEQTVSRYIRNNRNWWYSTNPNPNA